MTLRYPTSKIYHMALYAYHVCGLKTFTSLELYYLGPSAIAWYNAHLPADVTDQETAIKTKHGFSKEEWEEVMTKSSTFYFCPTAAMEACNRELRKLFGTLMIVNGAPYYTNYCRNLIRHAIKRGYFEYVDRTKQPFTYRINPQYADNPKMPKED